MSNSEFNLVDEPWVCLLSKDGMVKKEGLFHTFADMHNYLDLGGEIRLQDMAMLRLLISVSVTILYRYDENGTKRELTNSREALDRVVKVWKIGHFSAKAVEDYFNEWHDRFYLFDDCHPFFQITLCDDSITWMPDKNSYLGKKPVLKNGVYMNWLPIENINGRIQRSNNKPDAPFKDVHGDAAKGVSYDEAARWLLFYNAYADQSVGKRQKYIDKSGEKVNALAGKTLPSEGLLITPVGKNLFETVLLNCVLINNRNALYDSVCPAWEDAIDYRDLIEKKNIPNDLSRMYTQQARRMNLVRSDGRVVGSYVSAGEFYAEDQLWMEPAFVMKQKANDSGIEIIRSVENGLWQEIAYIAETDDKKALCTLTKWVNLLLRRLKKDTLSENEKIPFRATGIAYGSSNCSIQAMFEDSVILNSKFLEDTVIRNDAVREVENTKLIAKDAVKKFGDDIDQCMRLSGNVNAAVKKYTVGQRLQRLYLSEIGTYYASFLEGDITCEELKKAEYSVANNITEEYVRQNISSIFRMNAGDGADVMTLGKAEDNYRRNMAKIKKKTGGN